MSQCPRCGKQRIESDLSCPYCGIVYHKYKPQQMRPRVEVPFKPNIKPWMELKELKAWSTAFRNLGRLIQSGVPMSQALSKDPLLQSLTDLVDRNTPLTRALASKGFWFPSFVWGHLEAAELTGRFPGLLNQLSQQLNERRQFILRQIFNLRTLYLLFGLVAATFSFSALGAVSGLNLDNMPTESRAMIPIIFKGIVTNSIKWGLFFTLLAWSFYRFQMKWKHQLTYRFPWFERLRLSLPVTGQKLKTMNLTRYFNLLGQMLQAGLPNIRALTLAQRDIECPQWQSRFDCIPRIIESGGTLSDGFTQTGVIPENWLQELRTGEMTGHLPESCFQIMQDAEEQIQRSDKVITILASVFAFLFILGLTVIILIKGLLLPFEMIDKAIF